MPTSKITLPDVKVGVALASDLHVHHGVARDWFMAVCEAGTAFCRVTQMGLLRLLTNSRVMGDDVLNQQQAWAFTSNSQATSALSSPWNPPIFNGLEETYPDRISSDRSLRKHGA